MATGSKPVRIRADCSQSVVCPALKCASGQGNCFFDENNTNQPWLCKCMNGFTGDRCDTCSGTPADGGGVNNDVECQKNGKKMPILDLIDNTFHPTCGCACNTLRTNSTSPIPLYSGSECQCSNTFVRIHFGGIFFKNFAQNNEVQTWVQNAVDVIINDINLDPNTIIMTPKNDTNDKIPTVLLMPSSDNIVGRGDDILTLFFAVKTCPTSTDPFFVPQSVHQNLSANSLTQNSQNFQNSQNLQNSQNSKFLTLQYDSSVTTTPQELTNIINTYIDNPNAIFYNPNLFPVTPIISIYSPPDSVINGSDSTNINTPFYDIGPTTIPKSPLKTWQYNRGQWIGGFVSILFVLICYPLGHIIVLMRYNHVYEPSRTQQELNTFTANYRTLFLTHKQQAQAQLDKSMRARPGSTDRSILTQFLHDINKRNIGVYTHPNPSFPQPAPKPVTASPPAARSPGYILSLLYGSNDHISSNPHVHDTPSPATSPHGQQQHHPHHPHHPHHTHHHPHSQHNNDQHQALSPHSAPSINRNGHYDHNSIEMHSLGVNSGHSMGHGSIRVHSSENTYQSKQIQPNIHSNNQFVSATTPQTLHHVYSSNGFRSDDGRDGRGGQDGGNNNDGDNKLFDFGNGVRSQNSDQIPRLQPSLQQTTQNRSKTPQNGIGNAGFDTPSPSIRLSRRSQLPSLEPHLTESRTNPHNLHQSRLNQNVGQIDHNGRSHLGLLNQYQISSSQGYIPPLNTLNGDNNNNSNLNNHNSNIVNRFNHGLDGGNLGNATPKKPNLDPEQYYAIFQQHCLGNEFGQQQSELNRIAGSRSIPKLTPRGSSSSDVSKSATSSPTLPGRSLQDIGSPAIEKGQSDTSVKDCIF
jgi:hypothetical protein